MNAAAIIALITAIVQSGLAEKLINLLIQLFNSLSQEMQGKVANATAEKLLTWTTSEPVKPA